MFLRLQFGFRLPFWQTLERLSSVITECAPYLCFLFMLKVWALRFSVWLRWDLLFGRCASSSCTSPGSALPRRGSASVWRVPLGLGIAVRQQKVEYRFHNRLHKSSGSLLGAYIAGLSPSSINQLIHPQQRPITIQLDYHPTEKMAQNKMMWIFQNTNVESYFQAGIVIHSSYRSRTMCYPLHTSACTYRLEKLWITRQQTSDNVSRSRNVCDTSENWI